MERLAHLRARIGDIGELLEVVSTMRSLAAVRMQQATESLAGAREYAEVVEVALGEALGLGEPDDRPDGRAGGRVLLLFCSEHGFVGALNEAMLDHAADVLEEGGRLFVVGARGEAVAQERGIAVAWTLPMTSHRDGVPVLARRIAADLYHHFAAGAFTRLEMAYPRTRPGGAWSIERRSLLPLDPAALPSPPGRVPPLHSLPVPELIARLVEAYTMAQIVHGALEALAGENAARFAAMSAARENIEKRLADLRRLERQVRQEEITTELLDVITGARAVLEGQHST